MFQGVTTTEHIVFSPDTVSDLPVARKRPAFVTRLNHQTTQNANKAGRSLYRWVGDREEASRPGGTVEHALGVFDRPSGTGNPFLLAPASRQYTAGLLSIVPQAKLSQIF